MLDRPFCHYIATNLPQRAREYFWGLREAKPDLVGIALFDRLNKPLQDHAPLVEMMWQRREIENYLCQEEVLLAYARNLGSGDDLFRNAEAKRRETAMRDAITEISLALETLGQPSLWSFDIKVSDTFLKPLFDKYFGKLGLENLMYKTNYHELAKLVPKDKIDPEFIEKLDKIVVAAHQAKPRED